MLKLVFEIWLEIRFPVEYSEPRVGQYPIGYLYEPGLKYYVGKMINDDKTNIKDSK